MRMLGIMALVLASALALSGCAGMSEQACLVTDWRSVGFEDGVAGRSPGSIGSYRQACSRYGLTPSLDQYLAGHSAGVEVYCRAGNGFEAGRRGNSYRGVCPAELEPEFLAAYNEGRQLYELESALRSVESRIAAGHQRIAKLTQDIVAASILIVADETPSERRAELLLSTAAMAEEKVRIAGEIGVLESERALREADLYNFRQTLAFSL